MAIDARAERLFRVVEMKRADILDSDMLVDVVDHLFVSVARANLVAGCEDVTCVDADADASFVVDCIDDSPELFERAAEAGALSRCRFEQRDDGMTGNCSVDLIEKTLNLIGSVVVYGANRHAV